MFSLLHNHSDPICVSCLLTGVWMMWIWVVSFEWLSPSAIVLQPLIFHCDEWVNSEQMCQHMDLPLTALLLWINYYSTILFRWIMFHICNFFSIIFNWVMPLTKLTYWKHLNNLTNIFSYFTHSFHPNCSVLVYFQIFQMVIFLNINHQHRVIMFILFYRILHYQKDH